MGPTAGNLVAEHLTALLDKRPDPTAHIVRGRFVHADGSLSRRAAGAVGVEGAAGVAEENAANFGGRLPHRFEHIFFFVGLLLRLRQGLAAGRIQRIQRGRPDERDDADRAAPLVENVLVPGLLTHPLPL